MFDTATRDRSIPTLKFTDESSIVGDAHWNALTPGRHTGSRLNVLPSWTSLTASHTPLAEPLSGLSWLRQLSVSYIDKQGGTRSILRAYGPRNDTSCVSPTRYVAGRLTVHVDIQSRRFPRCQEQNGLYTAIERGYTPNDVEDIDCKFRA